MSYREGEGFPAGFEAGKKHGYLMAVRDVECFIKEKTFLSEQGKEAINAFLKFMCKVEKVSEASH